MSSFVSALVGGIVSAIVYPFITFWGIRFINSRRILVEIDDERKDFIYLKITNNSFITLKSVMGFITISNSDDDINRDIIGFCTTKVEHELLCWAKITDGKNKAEGDLNQGQMQRLNVLFHDGHGIQVPSEQGYTDKDKSLTGRIALKNRNYLIDVTITAENITPIILNLEYDSNEISLKSR